MAISFPTGDLPDGADLLVDYLQLEGVDTVFGIPGGGLIPLLETLKKRGKEIRFVLGRQESGAIFAADGYTRVKGQLGVGFVTSGPGALNALNAIVNANDSHSPVILMTGELGLDLVGKGYIQEGLGADLDIPQIYKGATTYSALCSDVENLKTQLEHALRTSITFPCSATHLTVPNDVTGAPWPKGTTVAKSTRNYRPTQDMGAPARETKKILDDLIGASKPLIFLGNGCRRALLDPESYGTEFCIPRLQKLIEFAAKFAIPVMTTPDGKGIFPETHGMSLRHYGKASATWPAKYMADPQHDALLTLGASLHDLDTERWNPELVPDGPFYQVDLDAGIIGRGFPIDLGVVAEVGAFIDQLYELAQAVTITGALEDKIAVRRELVAGIRKSSPFRFADKMDSDDDPAQPATIMKIITDLIPDDAHILIDAGNSIAWGCHYITMDPPHYPNNAGESVCRGQMHNALGMGPMGWATAAVVGTKVAAPNSACVTVTGDGAFMMQGTEVSTASAHGLGAIWVVLDNNDLAMVSQGMYVLSGATSKEWDKSWEGYYDFGNPDLVAFASGLGADAVAVSSPEDFRREFQAALDRTQDPEKPVGEGTKFNFGSKPQVIVVRINKAEIPPLYPPSMMPPGVE